MAGALGVTLLGDAWYFGKLVIKPKKVLVPAPSFSEYRKAAALYGADLEEFFLREEDSFFFTHETEAGFIGSIEELSEGDGVMGKKISDI